MVGLGNPEKKYDNTFHNTGFKVVDALAERLQAEFTKGECRAICAHTFINGEKVIIAKPITYMNLSGDSVIELINKYKIEKWKFIVTYDDFDLPLGQVRVRSRGSAGSHNGMRHIVQRVNSEEFARVRVGIYTDTPIPLIDYVLSKVPESREYQEGIISASDALYDFINGVDLEKIKMVHNKTPD
ncbi:MAG: aminoacyl-tRNA hydrolase [Clostridia bacterium]